MLLLPLLWISYPGPSILEEYLISKVHIIWPLIMSLTTLMGSGFGSQKFYLKLNSLPENACIIVLGLSPVSQIGG